MPIDITLACHDYDWTEALWTGEVTPEGVNLTTLDYKNPELWTRMIRNREFDACEMSFGTYLATHRSAREFPFTALPIFPYRKFRHAYIYTRDDAGIDAITDLEGTDAALVNWQTTTGLWQRGILMEYHGLDIRSVNWKAVKPEIVDLNLASFDVEYLNREGRARHVVEAMLDSGEVDAVFHPKLLDAQRGSRLFDDAVTTERQYFEETGIFPIMHTLVVDDDVLAEHPWLPQKLYDAFEAAKARGLQELDRPYGSPIVWSELFAEAQKTLLGGDPWEYGLTDSNRATLETAIQYALDQEILVTKPALEDLFLTTGLDTSRF